MSTAEAIAPASQAAVPAPAGPGLRSAIYTGTIRHRRHDPLAHEFSYPIGMLYLDLDELPRVLEHPPLWSARRRAPGRFRREDHLGDPAVPLKAAVAAEVLRQTGAVHDGPVRLLTTPRTFGRAFNPVSFYYCFGPDGQTVAFVVAEVTNTPWGERHSYVLDAREGAAGAVMRQSFDKVFHVSPFMGMDHRYAWSLTVPGPTLSVVIDSEQATRPGHPARHAFDATLSLHREPLTAGGLRALLARFPFQAARTGLLIYSHAVRMKVKGAPYFAHPEGHRPRLMQLLTRRPKTD